MRLSFDKGKYEIIFDEHTGTLEALRHGEPWRSLTGDNLILSMAQEVEALRAASPAKKPPYANMGEYLADLEAHASPAKEPTREGETAKYEMLAEEIHLNAYAAPKVRERLATEGRNAIISLLGKCAEAERRAADAEAKVEYARRVGLHVAIGTSTDCPEGRLQHDFTKGTELGRVFDEWSDSIGHEARLARTEAKLTAAESERDALRKALQFYAEGWEGEPNGDPRIPGDATGVIIDPSDDLLRDKGAIARAALAPASETTTPAEPKDFALVEDIARASLASLYSCMDTSVLPHVRKKIEDYISLLKRQASL